MTTATPHSHASNSAPLQTLGAQMRARRKTLRLSATVTAEAAGMSRVTLWRRLRDLGLDV